MLREYGPVLLVPAAWLTASLTITGRLGTQPLLVAHAVMAVVLVAFVASSWDVMDTDPVLRLWRGVMLGGIVATLAGVTAFLVPVCDCLFSVTLAYWMAAPGIALAITAAWTPDGSRDYAIASVLSLLGLTFFTTYSPIGLLLVGAGQTMGIVTAAVQE